jgi:hypothetical protein
VNDQDARLELAYNEALRALERQQQTVREFGTRSGNLMYAAAIVAAFLGAITIDDGSVGAWNWIALGALAGVGVLHTIVLWPRWSWRFRFQPHDMVEEFVDRRPVSIDDMRRELIDRIQADLDANLRQLRQIAFAFQLASALFLVETLAWLVALF